MAMDNTGQIRCFKLMLLTFTSVFVMTGVSLIVLGSTINEIYSQFGFFLQLRFFSPSFILVTVGFTVFVVAIIGFVGAIRESSTLIFLFAGLLQIVFAIEIGVSLAGFVLAGDVKDVLVKSLNDSMKDYETDPYDQSSVDSLQKTLQCCGVYNSSDWEAINITYPDSCCAIKSHSSCSLYYDDGCLLKLGMLINDSSLFLASAAVTIACIQWVGIIIALLLGRLIRNHKNRSEERRWIMRDQLLKNYDSYIPQPLPTKS